MNNEKECYSHGMALELQVLLAFKVPNLHRYPWLVMPRQILLKPYYTRRANSHDTLSFAFPFETMIEQCLKPPPWAPLHRRQCVV